MGKKMEILLLSREIHNDTFFQSSNPTDICSIQDFWKYHPNSQSSQIPRFPQSQFHKFDRNFFWSDHVTQIKMKCIKAKNIFAVLTKHDKGPSVYTLVTLFKALVCSCVDYGLIAYSSVSDTKLKEINVILWPILRLILGAFSSTPKEVLYSELGLEPVNRRREYLTSKYVINFFIKPNYVAYGTTYSIMAGDKVWRPRTTPCFVPCLKYLKFIEWEGFCEEPIYQPPPPWAPSLFNTLWFLMSKPQRLQNQQEARLSSEAHRQFPTFIHRHVH